MPYQLKENDFQEICLTHNLGEFQSANTVEGGRVHFIYKIKTIQKNQESYFVLKILNPITIETEFEKNRFVITDKIAKCFYEKGINSVFSRTGEISTLSRENEELNYMIFDWIDGKTLSSEEIDIRHCYTIGMQLAKMHHYFPNKEDNPYQNDMQGFYQFNFNTYLENKNLSDCIRTTLAKNIDKINEILSKHAQVILSLNQETQVMAHCDMDSTNTVWKEYEPFFIDWEKATASISPSKDFMITATYWSRKSPKEFSSSRYSSFSEGYQQFFENKKLPIPKINQNAGMLALLTHWLMWVDFNLKRASNNNLPPDQICIAEQQITKTLECIFTVYTQPYYAEKQNDNVKSTSTFSNSSALFYQQNNESITEPTGTSRIVSTCNRKFT